MTGVFSRSSRSSGRRSFLVEKMSTPLLFLACPLIPLFFGEDDLAGTSDLVRLDLLDETI